MIFRKKKTESVDCPNCPSESKTVLSKYIILKSIHFEKVLKMLEKPSLSAYFSADGMRTVPEGMTTLAPSCGTVKLFSADDCQND